MSFPFDKTTPAPSAVAALALSAGTAVAAPPTIGPQIRVDVAGGVEAANETSAASANPAGDEIVASWNDWRLSTSFEIINMGVAVSNDAGASWVDFLVRPPAGNQSGVEGDPMTAYDNRTGTLWVGAISFAGNGGIYSARKNPGANTFQPSVMIRTGGGIDKGWMAAGAAPGNPNATRVYCAYNLGIQSSADMGDTWGGITGLGSGIGFLPRVGPNGEVYVAYWDFGSGVRMKRSLNGGAYTTHNIANRMDVWSTQDGSRFPGTFRVPSLNYLAVDPNDGTLYAVYFDTTNIVNGQRNVDLYFCKSTNQGTSWTTPVVISEDPNPPGDQFFPWIEVDDSGRLHMVYYDSSNTVQNDNVVNGMFDANYAYSEDGGATWSHFRLTPNSFNSNDDGLNRSSQFMGDYLGLAYGGNNVYPCYVSTQNGDTDTFVHVISFASGAPDTFNVTRGMLQSGGLGEMAASDDEYLVIEQRFPPSVIDPNIQIEVETTSSESNPSSLVFTLEASSNVLPPTASQRIELYNYDANAWEQVDSRTATTGDSVAVITINTNAGRFVSGADRMAARLSWFGPGNAINLAWVARIDQVNWAVSP